MRESEKTSFLYGTNAAYIAELYEKYLTNPRGVSQEWQDLFADLKDNIQDIARDVHGLPWAKRDLSVIGNGGGTHMGSATEEQSTTSKSAAVSGDTHQAALDSVRAMMLIRSYRVRGHFEADLDPLGLTEREPHPELDPATYGFQADDWDRKIFINNAIPGVETATLREIYTILRLTYCGSIGVEYMHIHDPEIKDWIEERIETIGNRTEFTEVGRKTILERLIDAEEFEQFLHTKYVGTKRFGLDGGESLIPALEQILKRSSQDGVREVVVGMAHRGRLNVLCNVLGKPYTQLLAQFEGKSPIPDDVDGSGDVKYHMGASTDRTFDEAVVHLSLTSNPSHLEAVNPVVLGKVRAKQDQMEDDTRQKAMGILMHGDAAFAAQGIVAEGFLLSELDGYQTGGTIHVVINNQIGFTTRPEEGRSSPYCSDLAKMVQCPIFHVNGDDVEAVVHAARIAAEYRATFQKDVVLDVYCYRRYGHNEGDEPAFTQPVMYDRIKKHTSVRKQYAQKLIGEGVVSEDDAAAMTETTKTKLSEAFDAAKGYKANEADWLEGAWKGFGRRDGKSKEQTTGVDEKTLKKLGKALTTVPDGFNLNSKLQRLLKAKGEMFTSGKDFDWATAEALAFGSLLLEGHPVRLSGQDCKRGTFSQRHAVVWDQQNEATHTFLNNIEKGQEHFEVLNSPLSEEAVLGFEYGYTQADPSALVCWEAQFGDFVNGAQMIIDQFISSAESKWLRMSGLTMLLPHGFEGQGPEHSSARLERFLQQCAEDNMQVANCSTPANYFHILRRQLKRTFRKPLIIMTPKSLLRHKLCVSTLSDMAGKTTFQPVLPEADKLTAKSVKRVVLCTGKVYYDLYQARQEAKKKDVAIIRVEQLYPFPEKEIAAELKKYPSAKSVVWCQEEPENMGSWTFIDRRLENVMTSLKHAGKRPTYAGRAAAASPATGLASRHEAEQKTLVKDALGLK